MSFSQLLSLRSGLPCDSDLDDHFAEPLARQEEFDALEAGKQLLQAPVVEQLHRAPHAVPRDFQRVQMGDAESVGRHLFELIVGMEKRQHVGLGTHDVVQPLTTAFSSTGFRYSSTSQIS